MNKLVISKTLIFVVIMVYIFTFKFIFGNENILIAVMSITGLLMFMGRDLTGEPIKNMLGIILFYILIGIGSFLASGNLWIAIPINFIIIFTISYTFGHVLKAPMYIPFSFLYLFLLAYPISLSQMPLRIAALVVGAISIMLPQFIINKNKIKKSSEKIFQSLLNLLLEKVDLIKAGTSTNDIGSKINNMSKTLKDIIYDKKEKKFYISHEGRISLDFLVSIEKLSLLMDKYKNDKESEILDELKEFVQKLSIKNNKKDLIVYMDELKEKYSDTVDKNIIELLTSMMIITLIIKNLDEKPRIKLKNVKRNLRDDIYGLKYIKFNSIKLTYALRISIEVVIACFIMDYFHLEQGRWLMYTVLSLTSPLFETTKSKAKDRIIATIIGAIFIIVTFSIFKNTLIRSLIVMGAGYANMYCETYRQKIITVTVSAIGAVSLVGGYVVGNNFIKVTPTILSMERAILIIIGAIIAIVINQFLFRYDSKKANRYLAKISDLLIKDLIENLDIALEKESTTDYMNNIYLLNFQIEQTIKMNQSLQKNENEHEQYDKLRKIKQKIISNTYELQNFIANLTISENRRKIIKELILKIKEGEPSAENILFDIGESYMKTQKIEDKIIINLLFDIKSNLGVMEKYYESVIV